MSDPDPTLPEERQAEVLARWLEGQLPPGEIPAGLDPDVVESVLALRPDLAPELTLTADDILAGVLSGPLAVPSAGAAVDADNAPGDAGPAPQPAVAPAAEPPPANTPNRRWIPWLMAGAGSLAAAALIGLLVGPAMLSSNAPGGMGVAALEEANEPPSSAFTPQAGPSAKDFAGAEDDAVADLGEDPEPDGTAERGMRIPAPTAAKRKKEESAGDSMLEDDNDFGDGRIAGGEFAGNGVTRTTSGTTSTSSTTGGTLGGMGGVSAADGDLDAVADLELEEPSDEFDLEQEEVLMPEEVEEAEAPVKVTADDVARIPTGRSTSTRSMEAPAAAESETLDALSSGGGASAPSREERKEAELSSLEREARPSASPAGETQAVLVLLQQGKPEDARDQARRLLDGGGLTDLRRADLSWALGKAYEALGQESRARSAYKDAIDLRR